MYEKVVYFNGKKYRLHSTNKKYFWCTTNSKNSLHRDIWMAYNGEIPLGYHIHHIDGNRFNNDISNLECIDGKEHLRHHMKERAKNNLEWLNRWQKAGIEKAKNWHKSKDGIEWHRQNAIKNGFGTKTYGKVHCEFCYCTFEKSSFGARFCSNKCKSAQRRKNGSDKIIMVCDKCGEKSMISKYNKRKTGLCWNCHIKKK